MMKLKNALALAYIYDLEIIKETKECATQLLRKREPVIVEI